MVSPMEKNTRGRGKPPEDPAKVHDLQPTNSDFERHVLGAILTNDPETERVLDEANVEDFALPKHQTIYRRMRAMQRQGQPTDRLTVGYELQAHGELEAVDGLSYLVRLDDELPTPAHPLRYVEILRGLAQRRQAIRASDVLIKSMADLTANPAAVLAEHRDQLERIDRIGEAGADLMTSIPTVADRQIQTRYLVEGLILQGGITLWSGDYGCGKSTLALAVANAVAQGRPILGRATIQRPVVIIDRENGIDTINDRMSRLGITDTETPLLRIWGMWHREPPGPNSPEILRFVRDRQPFLIWDSLIAFAGGDENSSTEMRAHLHLYRRLCARGASNLILAHSSEKSETGRNYRGATGIPDGVDTGYNLSRTDGTCAGDPLGQLCMKPYKTRVNPGKPVRIEYKDGAFACLDVPPVPALDILKNLILVYPGRTQKELIALAAPQGLSEYKVKATLAEGVLKREIEVRQGRRRALHYYLPEVRLGDAA